MKKLEVSHHRHLGRPVAVFHSRGRLIGALASEEYELPPRMQEVPNSGWSRNTYAKAIAMLFGSLRVLWRSADIDGEFVRSHILFMPCSSYLMEKSHFPRGSDYRPCPVA